MSDTQSEELRPRRMQLVHEQQLPDRPQGAIESAAALPSPIAARETRTAPPEIRQELQARAVWRAGVIGSLNVAATILAVRLILLLAVIGAFTLGWRAVSGGQPMQLAAVGLYTLTVVLPITWLSARR